MRLGQRVRQLRLEKGMTQSQLAGDCITRNMLSQIENGQATPSVKTIEFLARGLGVSVGSLLSAEDGGLLAQARELLRAGDAAAAVEAALTSGASGDEYELLLCRGYAKMASDAFFRGHREQAEQWARQALEHNGKSLYFSQETESTMLQLLATEGVGTADADSRIADYRKEYETWGIGTRHHLLQARYFLSREQLQMAEREVWSITNLTDRDRPEYLIIRGRLALLKGKYSNAISFLKQVQAMEACPPRLKAELYGLLETAARETGNYKEAYEYAIKLREL